MNKEEQCAIDGKPLSESEIELIRAVRKYYICTILGTGEYDEQFTHVAYVDDDYKLRHLESNAVVIEMLDKVAQNHLANIFKQIKAEQ
jgi:hypothetical protein